MKFGLNFCYTFKAKIETTIEIGSTKKITSVSSRVYGQTLCKGLNFSEIADFYKLFHNYFQLFFNEK